MYERKINLSLPQEQSAFLWGARQTGKSTYLKQAFPDSYKIDLLLSDVYERYKKYPGTLREVIAGLPKEQRSLPVIIDEVQKVPALLDEVHYLIESQQIAFILCGSSARKLKRGGANLLGGRAWRFECFPLTSAEIPEFDLLKALNHGLLPRIYDAEAIHVKRSLRAYVQEYLKEEIQAEGLVRNLSGFAKFLDAAAFCSGELLNYTKIAADCAVDQKTVKAYFQILYDTLIGYEIKPYNKKVTRDILSKTVKFYLFDTGVFNQLTGQYLTTLQGDRAGKIFEHFILMELIAFRGYNELDYPIEYWRTKTGLEVDFVINHAEIAVEIKISKHVRSADIKGLKAFKDEHPNSKAYVVSLDQEVRALPSGILILPWQVFLQRLWNDEL
ncbi:MULTISPECIES: ATP-binding protein [Cysteiniphilum]|uniref:ATP-binding protein n=1 Tax=Cysteiniphilum TaxID=2056696 RepID=UPI00177BE5D2|nr:MULTISPECIES: AAA family ATPase [Cysteiniphilum]